MAGRPPLYIQELVKFYHSIEDGSCNVERGLAAVRDLIKEHKNYTIFKSCPSCGRLHHSTLDDMALVGSNQVQPEDIALQRGGFWEAGKFGLECGALWREVLGAPGGIYWEFQ